MARSNKPRKGRPRIYAHPATLHVRCDAELRADLQRAAKAAGLSMAQAVTHLLRVGLRESVLTRARSARNGETS